MPALLSTCGPIGRVDVCPRQAAANCYYDSSECPGVVLARIGECLFHVQCWPSDCNQNCSLGSLASFLIYRAESFSMSGCSVCKSICRASTSRYRDSNGYQHLSAMHFFQEHMASMFSGCCCLRNTCIYITKPCLECLEQKALLFWSPPLSMQILSREEPNWSFNLNRIEKLTGAVIEGWEK